MIDTDDILCVCADIGPCLLARYRRQRGRVEGLDTLSHGKSKRHSTMDSLHLDIECLLDGVTDDSWKYLDDDLITTCYHAPLEWIPLMRRIGVTTEYVRATT